MKQLILSALFAITASMTITMTVTGCATSPPTSPADSQQPVDENLVSSDAASPFIAEALYQAGDFTAAFDMDYFLATHGDDRSQFNTGISYSTGIEGRLQSDLIEAYAWMLTSESVRKEPGRADGIATLRDLLSEEQSLLARQRAAELLALHGSGVRAEESLLVGQSLESIEFVEQHAVLDEPESCSGVGTRIRTNCTGAKKFDSMRDFRSSPMVNPR